MAQITRKSARNVDVQTLRKCEEIPRQLALIKQDLSTLKIQRSRKIDEINHHRARETDARRRQREIEQDRPSPDAERPDRTGRRRKSADADTEQKSLRRFLGRIITTVAESALFANWVNRVRQAEREAANERTRIAQLEQDLVDIDREIAQTMRSDETLRNNWKAMSCSRVTGDQLRGRY